MSHIMDAYVLRYPQLSLPIEAGMSQDARYLDIVKRGRLPANPPNPFLGSAKDEELLVATPVGTVAVLHLGERRDFERFVQALRDRCEPVAIPPSMGALTLLGVINWRKIEAHKRQWLLSGHREAWGEEFKRFTALAENYRDTVLVVADGPYSALCAAEAGMPEAEWLAQSLTIRIWHELTHVICRRLWPSHQQAIRDEILADCVGLLAATGCYRPALARALLGVTDTGYRPGGRLQNYVPGGLPDEPLLQAVRSMIEALAARCDSAAQEPFAMLTDWEESGLGLSLFEKAEPVGRMTR